MFCNVQDPAWIYALLSGSLVSYLAITGTSAQPVAQTLDHHDRDVDVDRALELDSGPSS